MTFFLVQGHIEPFYPWDVLSYEHTLDHVNSSDCKTLVVLRVTGYRACDPSGLSAVMHSRRERVTMHKQVADIICSTEHGPPGHT